MFRSTIRSFHREVKRNIQYPNINYKVKDIQILKNNIEPLKHNYIDVPYREIDDGLRFIYIKSKDINKKPTIEYNSDQDNSSFYLISASVVGVVIYFYNCRCFSKN